MSIASSSYKPKSFQQSSDLEDLRQQVKVLIEENKVLTSQLEELIQVNNELTSSIEEYSKLHEQKFGPIDQSQLQDLANQVNELQRELQQEREKTQQIAINNTKQQKNSMGKINNHSRHSSSSNIQQQVDFNIDEIYEVIKQLTNNIHYLQQQFRHQLENLQNEFNRQRQQSEQMIGQMQQKFLNFQQLTKQLIQQMHSRDQVINNLNRQLEIQRNKKSQIHKQMKISLTIQDLKNTLERKIQQKQRVIKSYQALLAQLKTKFHQIPL